MHWNVRTIAVCLVLWAIPVASANSADGHIGIIKTVEGDGSISRNGDIVPAEPGYKLQDGDRLMTGAGSALGMTFLDGSQMSLGPDTELLMEEFVYEPQNDKMSMVASFLQGTFAHVSGGIGRLKPEAVKMRTPTGTVGIRGTKFVVRVP
jgi:hypothetical protein